MTFPSSIDCKIAQDLLVGYVAGEVSPETRTWMTQHLDRCPDCRRALAEYTDATGAVHQVPLMTPPSDPGRRTIFRMRRTVWAIAGVVVLCLVVTGGSLAYVFSNMRSWANMPVDQPVPASTYTADMAAQRIDLTPLGLKAQPAQVTPDMARLLYTDQASNPIHIELIRARDAAGARDAFKTWTNSYHSKVTSVEMNVGNNWTAKFRSQGQYFYGWQHERWLITISVPQQVPAATVLRDEIRDLLFSQIQAMQ